MEFEERTIKVIIDTTKCPDCSSKACVDACQVYDRGILQLRDGKSGRGEAERHRMFGL